MAPAFAFEPSTITLTSFLNALPSPAYIFHHTDNIDQSPNIEGVYPLGLNGKGDGGRTWPDERKEATSAARSRPVWSNDEGLRLMEASSAGDDLLGADYARSRKESSLLETLFAEVVSVHRSSSSSSTSTGFPFLVSLPSQDGIQHRSYTVQMTSIPSSPFSPHSDLTVCILTPVGRSSSELPALFSSPSSSSELLPPSIALVAPSSHHQASSPSASSSSSFSSKSNATARTTTTAREAILSPGYELISPKSLSPLTTSISIPLIQYPETSPVSTPALERTSFFPELPLPIPINQTQLPSRDISPSAHSSFPTSSASADSPSFPRTQSLGDRPNCLLFPGSSSLRATSNRSRSSVDYFSSSSAAFPPAATTASHDRKLSTSTTALASPSTKDRFVSTVDLMETFDWASTPLGARDQWPQSLKTAVSIVMSMTTQGCLWWEIKDGNLAGEWWLIYNDAYAHMSGKKHPWMFGGSAESGWHEIWENLKPMVKAYTASHRENELFLIQRTLDQRDEESYFSWSFVPVQTEKGTPGGVLNSCYETTGAVLAERRLQVLRSLAQSSFTAKTSDDLVEALVEALKEDPKDIPFVMIYHGAETARDTTTSTPSGPGSSLRLRLMGTIGVPDSHPSAPSSLILDTAVPASSGRLSRPSSMHDLRQDPPSSSFSNGNGNAGGGSSMPTFPSPLPHTLSHRSDSTFTDSQSSTSTYHHGLWYETRCDVEATMTPYPFPVAEAVARKRPILVEDCSELVKGFELRSWDELPSRALVIPIKDVEEDDGKKGEVRSQMVLIVGLNARRPFDDEYRSWLRLLKLQLGSALAGVSSYAATVNRADELAQLDRAKSQFFSNISHELRTPLTLIQGPINDLLANPERADRKGMLSVASRNIDRLSRLVDTLMDVSRVEAGKLHGNFVPRDLVADTANLASLFRSAIEAGGIEYTVQCDTNNPAPVYVDPDLWEKIVLNLLSNAYKYCLSGSIRVTAKYVDNTFEFSVEDTGVGIPKDDLGKVTSRFHRVQSHSRSFEGTGIGLSLVSELVGIHGGTLDIKSATAEESAQHHGSTFCVRIPLGRSHLPPDRIREDADPKDMSQFALKNVKGVVQEMGTWGGTVHDSGSSSGGARSSSAKSGSVVSSSESDPSRIDPNTLFWTEKDLILVVDDNADMRHYLSSILSQYCTVQQACDGRDALEIMKKRRPNLIISDVMMPNLDGPGLLDAIRTSDTELALCPVIFVTAKSSADDRVETILMGAEDVLAKPFSSKELIARSHLQMQMGKRRIELERNYNLRTQDIQMRAVEAEERRAQAEEQRRQQELLMDVTSHELRNPVSAIIQNAGLCKENLNVLYTELAKALKHSNGLQPTASLINMVEEDLEGLDAIVTMGLSMERIANDVLSLARIQLSTLEIFRVEMDLKRECTRVCSVFGNECRLKRIHLQLDFGLTFKALIAQDRTKILTDAVRLNQIWVNLLSNSIRFTAPSPVRDINMSIELRRSPPLDDSCLPPPVDDATDISDFTPGEECWLYGAIQDTGPGLTSQELGRLFQKFRQASSETHARFGGSGLGLYVARAICELMDGAIEVASEKGEGSTFRFFIKVGLPPVASPIAVVEPPRVPTPTAPSRALDVLIVEDNLINQRVLMRQLTKAGFRTQVTSDGLEALGAIKAKASKGSKFDIILMDLEMPVMDGLTCIQTIRKLESGGELSPRNLVFALTGNARQGQIDSALAAGMDSVFIKPYRIDELLAKLRLAAL